MIALKTINSFQFYQKRKKKKKRMTRSFITRTTASELTLKKCIQPLRRFKELGKILNWYWVTRAKFYSQKFLCWFVYYCTLFNLKILLSQQYDNVFCIAIIYVKLKYLKKQNCAQYILGQLGPISWKKLETCPVNSNSVLFLINWVIESFVIMLFPRTKEVWIFWI